MSGIPLRYIGDISREDAPPPTLWGDQTLDKK